MKQINFYALNSKSMSLEPAIETGGATLNANLRSLNRFAVVFDVSIETLM